MHGLSQGLEVVEVVVADLHLFENGLFLVFCEVQGLGDVVYVWAQPVDIALMVV